MLSIRNATSADLPAIMEVEQSWPEDARAEPAKFSARLEKFPQGFFLAEMAEGEEKGRVIATITAMPLRYHPSSMASFQTWAEVTNDGYLHDVDMTQSDALYIVSGVIDSRYRRHVGIFAKGVLHEVALARELGMRYVVAGAVMPGYSKYCEQHGAVSAFEYCRARRGTHLVDPLLAIYESIGFSVPDEAHVIADYYPDEASRNYAALVVRDLEKSPL